MSCACFSQYVHSNCNLKVHDGLSDNLQNNQTITLIQQKLYVNFSYKEITNIGVGT